MFACSKCSGTCAFGLCITQRLVMARVKVEEEIILPEKKTGGLYFSSPRNPIGFIPTGSKTLDLALGGGWARRRIANILSDRAVGKTLLAIEACANFNIIEPKGKIRYRETESAFDHDYAAALGFPVNKIDFGDGMIETVEDIFEDLEKVVNGAKGPELYVIDSLDALSDRSEMERSIDKGTYGASKAKLLSQLFRRLVRSLAEKDITLIVVSQIRENIDAGMFAKKWTRSGGKALDFYCSQVLYLSQIEKIKKTIKGITRVTGTRVKAVVEKNKISLPYREAEFQILFGFGVNDRAACLDYLKQATIEVDKDADLGIIHKLVETSWYEIENRFIVKDKKY
jgi:recombination protein RecA